MKPAVLIASLLIAGLACGPKSPPPKVDRSRPISLLPEKRIVYYWNKGCDDPDERVAEILGPDDDLTILWQARCADGRVLRCSYHRLLKCRWERKHKIPPEKSASTHI
jgi:hypothetical protein